MGHVQSKRTQFELYAKPARPLLFGVATFILCLMFWSSIQNSSLFPKTPFIGMKFIYCMFLASISTTIIGTLLYFGDLSKMKQISQDTPGYSKLKSAFGFLLIISAIIVAPPFILLLFPGIIDRDSICDFESFQSFIHIHDIFVGIIFICFAIIDSITLAGMRAALESVTKKVDECRNEIDILTKDFAQSQLASLETVIRDKKLQHTILVERKAEISFSSGFAKLQLSLIDIPVIVGIIIISIISSLALHDSGWNSRVMGINPSIVEFMSDNRISDLFTCNEDGVTIQQYQKYISRIFSAGIATGFVASTVIFSQIVFCFLNILYDKQIKEVDKPGAVDMTLAIS